MSNTDDEWEQLQEQKRKIKEKEKREGKYARELRDQGKVELISDAGQPYRKPGIIERIKSGFKSAGTPGTPEHAKWLARQKTIEGTAMAPIKGYQTIVGQREGTSPITRKMFGSERGRKELRRKEKVERIAKMPRDPETGRFLVPEYEPERTITERIEGSKAGRYIGKTQFGQYVGAGMTGLLGYIPKKLKEAREDYGYDAEYEQGKRDIRKSRDPDLLSISGEQNVYRRLREIHPDKSSSYISGAAEGLYLEREKLRGVGRQKGYEQAKKERKFQREESRKDIPVSESKAYRLTLAQEMAKMKARQKYQLTMGRRPGRPLMYTGGGGWGPQSMQNLDPMGIFSLRIPVKFPQVQQLQQMQPMGTGRQRRRTRAEMEELERLGLPTRSRSRPKEEYYEPQLQVQQEQFYQQPMRNTSLDQMYSLLGWNPNAVDSKTGKRRKTMNLFTGQME